MREVLARTEIAEQRASIAVNDALASFRILHLPKGASDNEISAAVARELPLDPERIVTRWVDLVSIVDRRVVYAAAWDRGHVRTITDAVRSVGIDPTVVELRSAAVARAVSEPSCIVVDLCTDPAEIVLIDGHVPQVWHSVRVNIPGSDPAALLAPPLRTVLRFYRRRHVEFAAAAPVLISAEQIFSAEQMAGLAHDLGQPVMVLPPPRRVPPEVRHPVYLACLGLIMRRSG